jgi:hypothetical protein
MPSNDPLKAVLGAKGGRVGLVNARWAVRRSSAWVFIREMKQFAGTALVVRALVSMSKAFNEREL